MSDGDEVGMTVKQMVSEVYRDVKQLRTDVAVLTAAKLPDRVDALEAARTFSLGRREVVAALAGMLGVLVGIVITLADHFLV